ncbi:MAG: hypothetical protein WC523_04140 [Patescibacteria group bacterium]
MEDMWKTKNKMSIKPHSSGPWVDGVSKRVLNNDGTIGVNCLCGHWDYEDDKFGYCNDEECRRERFIKALYDGEAMMMPNGDIIWTPGIKIRQDK